MGLPPTLVLEIVTLFMVAFCVVVPLVNPFGNAWTEMESKVDELSTSVYERTSHDLREEFLEFHFRYLMLFPLVSNLSSHSLNWKESIMNLTHQSIFM